MTASALTERNDLELARSSFISTPLAFPDVFSPPECDAIIALGAGHMRYISSQIAPLEGHRQALTAWLDEAPESRFISDRLTWFLNQVNTRYGFALAPGIGESFLLAEYHEGDGFEWHLDADDAVTSTRKLSLSIQLSPPEAYYGGRFEFMPYGEIPFSTGRGTVIVFPSYLCHRVTRVTRGSRNALVAWAHGPTFR